MNKPLNQTVLEQGFGVGKDAALRLLQAKYKALKVIEAIELDAVTESEGRRYKALQQEVMSIAGIITSFDDYIESLHKLLEEKENKIFELTTQNTFLHTQVCDYIGQAYRLDLPLLLEPKQVRECLNFLLNDGYTKA